MRVLQILLSIFVFLFSSPNVLICQQTVTASGGDVTSSGGSISYTVGQVAYSFSSNLSTEVSEGVQQAFEISTVTYIEPFSNTEVVISIFPNPTTSNIIIRVSGEYLKPLRYRLVNITGQSILSGEINSSSFELITENLPASVYILHLIQNESQISTQRIIKS